MKSIKRVFGSLLLHVYPVIWKLLAFRGKLNENHKREKGLEKQGVFQRRSLVIFGDSQVSLWRMATFFKSLPIRNRGLSGDTVRKALDRFDNDVIPLKPDAVVVLIGANDIAQGRKEEEIALDFDQIIAKCLKCNTYPFICSVLPVSGKHAEIRPLHKLKALNQLLKVRTQHYYISYIDFWEFLADANGYFKSEFTYDGLHPNKKAYSFISAIVKQKYNAFVNKEDK